MTKEKLTQTLCEIVNRIDDISHKVDYADVTMQAACDTLHGNAWKPEDMPALYSEFTRFQDLYHIAGDYVFETKKMLRSLSEDVYAARKTGFAPTTSAS
jgi:hypothetical protein